MNVILEIPLKPSHRRRRSRIDKRLQHLQLRLGEVWLGKSSIDGSWFENLILKPAMFDREIIELNEPVSSLQSMRTLRTMDGFRSSKPATWWPQSHRTPAMDRKASKLGNEEQPLPGQRDGGRHPQFLRFDDLSGFLWPTFTGRWLSVVKITLSQGERSSAKPSDDVSSRK